MILLNILCTLFFFSYNVNKFALICFYIKALKQFSRTFLLQKAIRQYNVAIELIYNYMYILYLVSSFNYQGLLYMHTTYYMFTVKSLYSILCVYYMLMPRVTMTRRVA